MKMLQGHNLSAVIAPYERPLAYLWFCFSLLFDSSLGFGETRFMHQFIS